MAIDRVDDEQTLEVLRTGEIEVLGLLPYSSNYTFLARVASSETLAVYKPRRGERPLWDFPHGSLAGREAAAYVVSEAGGWAIVPPTVLREDAPLGPGSLQLFVEHDPERHYFTLMEERAEDLVAFAAFDVVINNADRKSGHVIEDGDGRLWAVDHGVTFHLEDKLRTVIWAYAGLPLDPVTITRLETLGASLAEPGGLGTTLEALLTPAEVAATLARTEALLVEGHFPQPPADRPLPWPLV
ncbi:MAG: SCO1664 family protein [Actinomycetota bacterium]|nr:SCO1664 family protein [Actinomycetota bacterium]